MAAFVLASLLLWPGAGAARWRAAVAADDDGPIAAENEKPRLVLREGAGEGPAWDPEWGLLFSGHGNIMRMDRMGQLSIYLEKAGSNGLLFDRRGRLLICQPVTRRLGRLERDGTLTVLTDRYEGKRYNQPNDVTVDARGRIYFSDPRYGSRDGMELVDDVGRRIEGVYRIDLDGSVTRVITHEVDRPNGLLVTPDDRYLYVADNNNNTVGGARKLWRFDLRPDGSIDAGSRRLIFDWASSRGPDGMAIDARGRLFVAGGRNRAQLPYETNEHRGGIYVFSPAGELLEFFAVPRDEVTNCAFGGDALRTLYITAGGTLWSLRVTTPGRVLWPR